MQNKVIKILVSSDLSGYRMIRVDNWDGNCFIVPRQNLKNFEKRPESNFPALYFLIGQDEDVSAIYIGESENGFSRISHHDLNKDFWDYVVVFNGNLDKGKVKYLEYLSLLEAKKSNKYKIKNEQEVNKKQLDEFDETICENYFANIKFILESLNYDIFLRNENVNKKSKKYFLKGDGYMAEANLLDSGEMLVLEGSKARVTEAGAMPQQSKITRNRFLADGTLLKSDSKSYKFTKDTIFSSVSFAASMVNGRSTNGWTAWKDEKGKTLDENVRRMFGEK